MGRSDHGDRLRDVEELRADRVRGLRVQVGGWLIHDEQFRSCVNPNESTSNSEAAQLPRAQGRRWRQRVEVQAHALEVGRELSAVQLSLFFKSLSARAGCLTRIRNFFGDTHNVPAHGTRVV